MSNKGKKKKHKYGHLSPEARAKKRKILFLSMLGIVSFWLILSFYLVLSGKLQAWADREEKPKVDPRMEAAEDF
ncbi:MAG: hypothetical protein ACI9TH_002285 [Kiritimatiellia bacterium]|jgi:hypothetical protein